MLHTTQQLFCALYFKTKIFTNVLHTYLHATVLKISGKSNKNFLSYEGSHGTWRVGYNAFRKE